MPIRMAELSHVPKHPFSQRMWKLWLPSHSEILVITKSSSFFFFFFNFRLCPNFLQSHCNLTSVTTFFLQPPNRKVKKKICLYLSVNDVISTSFPLFSPFSWHHPFFRLLGISMNHWMQIHTYLVAVRYTATCKDEVHLQTPHCASVLSDQW